METFDVSPINDLFRPRYFVGVNRFTLDDAVKLTGWPHQSLQDVVFKNKKLPETLNLDTLFVLRLGRVLLDAKIKMSTVTVFLSTISIRYNFLHAWGTEQDDVLTSLVKIYADRTPRTAFCFRTKDGLKVVLRMQDNAKHLISWKDNKYIDEPYNTHIHVKKRLIFVVQLKQITGCLIFKILSNNYSTSRSGADSFDLVHKRFTCIYKRKGVKTWLKKSNKNKK